MVPDTAMTSHPTNAPAGLDKMAVRHLLLLWPNEALPAALALDAEGTPIILLDRHKPPRSLEREIKERAPDSDHHRFGTIASDPARPGLVRFVLNRAAPGMARKLMKALKGTGLRRVEIALTSGETEEADDEEAVAHQADLTHALAGLLHRAVDATAADPGRKPALSALAEAAQAALKHGEPTAAAQAITALRDALG